MEENAIKQTENFVEIVGLLKKVEVEFKQGDKGAYASGNLEVEVTVGDDVNVIKVKTLQMEMVGKGENRKENKAYKALKTIVDTYNTIDKNGRENAQLVQVFGRIEENNYYLVDQDELKEGIVIMACTHFDKEVFTPIAKAEAGMEQKALVTFEGMITNVIPNETTGELKVEMVGADFRGQAVKHKMDVSSELAQPFGSMYQVGAVTTLFYNIVNSVEVKEVAQEVAFGNVEPRKITKTTRKNLVVGGLPVNYESTMTQEIVTKMLAVRVNTLEQVKQDAINKAKNGGASAATNAGAGANPFAGAGTQTGNPFGGAAGAGANPFGAGANPFGN